MANLNLNSSRSALIALSMMPHPDLTFADVGSGVGRLVHAAAALWPHRFARCTGVECVAELHQLALVADAELQAGLSSPLPPRQFVLRLVGGARDGWAIE